MLLYVTGLLLSLDQLVVFERDSSDMQPPASHDKSVSPIIAGLCASGELVGTNFSDTIRHTVCGLLAVRHETGPDPLTNLKPMCALQRLLHSQRSVGK